MGCTESTSNPENHDRNQIQNQNHNQNYIPITTPPISESKPLTIPVLSQRPYQPPLAPLTLPTVSNYYYTPYIFDTYPTNLASRFPSCCPKKIEQGLIMPTSKTNPKPLNLVPILGQTVKEHNHAPQEFSETENSRELGKS